ncbi:uncharacterized protein LOC132304041 [Cornus florida]|uniref:uncharacterized protein LOC132304041 n=1 Tax=Cornus florida TaxID=4283 RepID=UPI0028A10EF3|nr:uncharacterized protein LOC132304041 [Cornus florida]
MEKSICYNFMQQRHPMSCSDYSSITFGCCHEMFHKYSDDHALHRFESPMPWIGIYIAAASLVCSLAMAADVFHGFHHRKLWFPCKFFTLNAASLTLLAVAMKLPVDLSTSMTTAEDQLAKLSSTTFMSTAMGNFLPSFGTMNDKEIFVNITALAIFVITIFVNICIQLTTLVINPFFVVEHIAALSFMLVLLVISGFTALTVSTTKKRLQLNYDDMHKKKLVDESEETEKLTIEKLKENVKKYWMMAETSSPQFVIARSVTCYASGAICLLAVVTFAEAYLRLRKSNPEEYKAYKGSSLESGGYSWSTIVVLVIQCFGVFVGTIAPTFRSFTAIRLRCPEKRVKSNKSELKIETYWIERLVGWRESPIALQVRGQKFRKLVHKTKNLIVNIFIGIQIMIVKGSKLILVISIFLTSLLISFGQKLGCKPTVSNNYTEPEWRARTKLDLSRYVLYLEGEEELPLQIMENNRDATNHFIQKGKKQQSKYLKELIDRSTSFMGVAKFDSNQVPPLASEEPPNCWSLPVITLTSIAVALPNNENHKVNELLQSVREGLLFVNLVEKILDAKGDLVNIKNTADIVWLGVDLFRKWLDEDLRKIALERKTSKETLERLLDISRSIVMEFKANLNGKENPLKWPMKVIAANSMYRISQTLLLDQEGSKDRMDHERLFDQLSVMVADILGACLTNMPRVITTKCFCSAIEEREKSVQHAAHLLGETEEILEILQQRELPSLNPDQAADIDEWRASMKKKDPSAFTSSSNSGSSSSGSCQLHIAIE